MPGKIETAYAAQALSNDIAERLWMAAKLKVLSPKRAFSMNDAAEIALFLTERLFRNAGITVQATLQAGVPEVDAHMGHVEQALVNVLANACEATGRGGCVAVASRYVAADRAVEVEVADTGVGMSSDVQASAFEPFFSTKGHIGIGLSTAQELMSRWGGEIRIESCVGAGSKVTLRLPAMK